MFCPHLVASRSWDESGPPVPRNFKNDNNAKRVWLLFIMWTIGVIAGGIWRPRICRIREQLKVAKHRNTLNSRMQTGSSPKMIPLGRYVFGLGPAMKRRRRGRTRMPALAEENSHLEMRMIYNLLDAGPSMSRFQRSPLWHQLPLYI